MHTSLFIFLSRSPCFSIALHVAPSLPILLPRSPLPSLALPNSFGSFGKTVWFVADCATALSCRFTTSDYECIIPFCMWKIAKSMEQIKTSTHTHTHTTIVAAAAAAVTRQQSPPRAETLARQQSAHNDHRRQRTQAIKCMYAQIFVVVVVCAYAKL